jgi:hypothetical protein
LIERLTVGQQLKTFSFQILSFGKGSFFHLQEFAQIISAVDLCTAPEQTAIRQQSSAAIRRFFNL